MLPQLAGPLCFDNDLQKTATGMCVFIHVFVVIVLICSNYSVMTGLGPFTNQETRTQLRCRLEPSQSVGDGGLLQGNRLVPFITSGCYIVGGEAGVFLVYSTEKQRGCVWKTAL